MIKNTALIMALPLLLCLAACEPAAEAPVSPDASDLSAAPSDPQLTTPPVMQVFYPVNGSIFSLSVNYGASYWSYENEDGTGVHTSTDAPHPLSDIINIPAIQMADRPGELEISFSPMPDSFTVRRWDESYIGVRAAYEKDYTEPAVTEGRVALAGDGRGHVYLVTAQWPQGSAQYSFYVSGTTLDTYDDVQLSYETGALEARYGGEPDAYLTLNTGDWESQGLSGKDIAIRAEHFAVPESRVEMITKQLELTGTPAAREQAIKTITQKYSMYCAALLSGCSVTDAQIKTKIEENKKTFGALESRDEAYAAYLGGLGMTNEAYWDSQYEQIKIQLVMQRFLEGSKEAFLAEKNAAGADPIEALDQWDAYWENRQEQILAGENIQVLTG